MYRDTGVIGPIEAIEVLMGFQQHSMSRPSIYLPTEVNPSVKILKGKKLLEELPADSEDIFYMSKFQVYLLRPGELRDITYPDMYKWWRQLLPGETQRAVQQMEQQQLTAIASDDSDTETNENGDLPTSGKGIIGLGPREYLITQCTVCTQWLESEWTCRYTKHPQEPFCMFHCTCALCMLVVGVQYCLTLLHCIVKFCSVLKTLQCVVYGETASSKANL